MADDLTAELNEGATDLRREMSNIKADLAVLRGDMSNLLGSVMEFTKNGAGNVKDKAYAEMRHTAEKLNETYSNLREQGGKAAETVQKRVEEHPLQSILLALGLGLIVGHFMGNGHKD